MAVIFAGTELDAFIRSDGTCVASTFGVNTTRCREGIRVGSASGVNASYIQSPAFPVMTSFWYKMTWANAGSISSGTVFTEFRNAGGTPLFRLFASSVGVIQPQYWNGSAWTNIGSSFSISTGVGYVFDLKVIGGVTGSCELYQDGVLRSSGSANMSLVVDITHFRLYSSNNSSNTCTVSEIILADEPTIGWIYYSRPPVANGANTAWTGDFTAVDESGNDSTDFIESTTANQTETFQKAAVTMPVSGAVKAVTITGTIKNSATGPQNAQFVLRKGGVDYTSPTLSGVGLAYTPFYYTMNTDPSTTIAWASGDIASATVLEFGVKSIT